jgi:hypothetical protein
MLHTSSHFGAIQITCSFEYAIVDIKSFDVKKTKARMDDPTHSYAINALRRQKEAKKSKSIAKDFRDSLIQTVLSWLNEAKEKKNGRKLLPYRKCPKLFKVFWMLGYMWIENE